MDHKLRLLLRTILFVLGFSLVINGQKTISYNNLGIMILGLALILLVVWDYNQTSK